MNESSLAPTKIPAPSARLATLLLVFLASSLIACGGGPGSSVVGGNQTTANRSSSASDWKPGTYKPSNDFKNLCQAPRKGFSKYTGEPFPDKKGTTLAEKNFLRSWSYETYLWFEELPDVNPANTTAPVDYFLLLKTNKRTASGAPKDQFHFFEPTEEAEANDEGIAYGYGMQYKSYSVIPPRSLMVAYVEPGSPAALAGVARGAKILGIDSYNFVTENSEAGVNAINEGLFPGSLGAAHNFLILDADATEPRTLTLQSAAIETSPVLLARVLETDNGKVGYLVFNSHVAKAEGQWIKAIQEFQQAGVADLVLDLRYNGGGLLITASQVSYMLAGSNAQGKVFYEQIRNSKSSRESPFPFYDLGYFSDYKELPLPTLNLQRVYILSSNGTCSASEAIINGLRGADIQVYLIGDITCGKPYGFVPEPNCGTTYYTIQMKGANAKGFGDYSDGFIPSAQGDNQTRVQGCRVQDDLTHQLGDANEAMLATALQFRATGSCSLIAANKLQKVRADFVDGEFMIKESRKLLIVK